MPQDNDFSFLNEARDETFSLRSKKKPRSAWWLHWLAAFTVFGAFLFLLNHQGYFQISVSEKIPKPEPKQVAIVPAPLTVPLHSQTNTNRLQTPPQPPSQISVRPGPSIVQPPSHPQASADTNRARLAQTRGDVEKIEEKAAKKTPQQILEEKGLKPDGNLFVLEQREANAIGTFDGEVPRFVQLRELNTNIYNIDYMKIMIDYAQSMKDGLAFDNADLNTAMDSIPRWGGLRVNGLNSVQRGMNDQLLSNRQDITNLDRLLSAWRAEFRTYPPRAQLVARFNELVSSCRSSLAEIETVMNGVVEEYVALNKDDTVREAVAADNRQTRTTKTVGMTEGLKKRLRAFKEEKKFFDISPSTVRRR